MSIFFSRPALHSLTIEFSLFFRYSIAAWCRLWLWHVSSLATSVARTVSYSLLVALVSSTFIAPTHTHMRIFLACSALCVCMCVCFSAVVSRLLVALASSVCAFLRFSLIRLVFSPTFSSTKHNCYFSLYIYNEGNNIAALYMVIQPEGSCSSAMLRIRTRLHQMQGASYKYIYL